MSVAKTVLRNVASSWVGLGSHIVLTFILTPFVIAQLGLEAYGVWLLLQALVGYYGLVDMGLRAGLTQSITRRIARNDIEGVRRHVGAAIPALSLLSLIVPAIAMLLCVVLPWAVQMDAKLVDGLWLVILIQAFAIALQIPLAPYSAVLVGLQRYDVANGLAVITRLVAALLTYIVLGLGGGLIGYSIVIFLSNALDGCLRCRIAMAMLPGIRGARFTWDREELGEIANVGIWNFLIHISRQLIYFSDALTVGFLFSAAAVAPFGIAGALIEYGNRLVTISTKVLFPTMSSLREQANRDSLKRLYLAATRITLATSITILLIGSFWISPFLRLWLGTSDDKQPIHLHAPSLFVALGVAFTFVGLQRVGTQLWLAENKLRSLALALAVEGISNILLSLSLGWYIGLIGVAVGTAIPAAVMCFAVHLPMHAKFLQLPYANLVSQVLTRPLIYGILLLPIMYWLAAWIPVGDSWLNLLGAGVLVTLAAGSCSIVVLSRQELAFVKEKLYRLFGRALTSVNLATRGAPDA